MVKVEELLVRDPKLSKKVREKKYSIQFLTEYLIVESGMSSIIWREKKLKTTYLIDIVHNLLLKYYFKKENSFNLSSIVLKEKYGHLYNYYMDYLIDKGIIELIKNYKVGRNAKVFKLNENVINGKITRFKNDDRVLIKKYISAITQIESKTLDKNIIDSDVKIKLVKDLFCVNIEYDRAIFFLESINQGGDIYQKNKWSVECIKDTHIFFHFDSYGRMHTNFTILKSFIRKNCLIIDGQETYEMDIKNSQPLFLCKLIERESPEITASDEFKLFKILTRRGIFYQYLIENLNGIKKKEVKEFVYKVLFGRNIKSKSDILFSSLFPKIHLFIKTYKKIKGDYRVLAYELQRLESNLIYNKCVKKIFQINPDIKLITVHDSIICPIKWKDIVEDIFLLELENEFGKIE